MRARQSSTRSRRIGAQRGRAGGRMWVWTSRLRMLAAALLAGGVGGVAEVALEHRRKLLDDVGEVERLAVELLAATVADPEEGVLLVGQPPPLDHEAHGVGWPLRRVRRAGRQEEDLALADGQVDQLSALQDAQGDVALDLVEELLALVDVVVGAAVRAAHDGDHEVPIAFPDLRVADGRLEQVAVLVDPPLEVDRLHGERTSAMHFSSMAMGVGSA